MRTRAWLSLLFISPSLPLFGCSDDVTPAASDGSGDSTSAGSTTVGADSTGLVDSTADTGPFAGCGDGLLTVDEVCDDGNSAAGDGCSDTCEVEIGYRCDGQPSECFVVCGDGLVIGQEGCDDDNLIGGDGCTAECQVEPGYACNDEPSICDTVCGDGLVVAQEICDDANTTMGDGCSAECTIEDGFECDTGVEPNQCTEICGDGQIVGIEECDDNNESAADGCSETCEVELGWSCGEQPSVCMTGCGDGIIAGQEQCDDQGNVDGDGCNSACALESGWTCMGIPSVCSTECGDGLIAGLEGCDDGDMMADDGCSDVCELETGYTCQGQPSVCATTCGDGITVADELCDDGNFDPGDGCSLQCTTEFGWDCVGTPSACTLIDTLERVSLGIEGGCVLTALGDVGCFGANSQGDVGIGVEDVEVFIPTLTFNEAIAISSGEEHHCAVRINGSVWCWGDNSQAQLGANATAPTDEFLPIEVPGLPLMLDIDSGDDHNCGRDLMNEVWCWGDNNNRQLGRGGMTTGVDPNPAMVQLPGGLDAIDLGIGDDHSCVVLSDQTVACWGDDDNGQLGDGMAGDDSGDPAVVVGLPAIDDVQSGNDHTCALSSLGEVYCWGNNIDGQLGDGGFIDSPTPLLVTLPAAATHIGLGDDFSCALLMTNQIFCWGEGSDFQLANGDLVDEPLPQEVLEAPLATFIDLEVGSQGACVVTTTGQRYCWGDSDDGRLGISPHDQLSPQPVTFSGPVQQLILSPAEYRGLLCGVMPDGSVECAGHGTTISQSSINGAQGLFGPITRHIATPTPIPMLSDVQQMGLGDGFGCIATTNDVQCWGDNSNFQLGQGGTDITAILTPVPVVGLGAVDELEVGDQFACVRIGGTVQCWGDNQSLQTGEGSTTTDQSTPRVISGLFDATDIELGEDHACALLAGGQVRCWGDDSVGQLGDNDGDVFDSAVPVNVVGLPAGVEQIAVGQDHACALAAGEVYCWGTGQFGNLGQGNEIGADAALLVPGLSGIVQIGAGFNSNCARDPAGTLRCWGYSREGLLGNGGVQRTGRDEERVPVEFEVANNITDFMMGNSSTCIQSVAGWRCVGYRATGQLGNGTTLEPAVPTLMMFGL